MVTKEQCMTSRLFRYLQSTYKSRDRRGEPIQVRASGKCQTWKRDPERFRLPVKYGMYESGEITNENAALYITEDEYQQRKSEGDAFASVLENPRGKNFREIGVFQHQGREFSSGGATRQDNYLIAYLGKNHVLTTWDGRPMGQWRILSTWHTPRSYISSTMHSVVATLDNGEVFTGRSAGEGMMFRGKLSPSRMKMKKNPTLKPIGSNMNDLVLDNGNTVLYSYSTPVAIHILGKGFYKTSHKWSRTTSKHITKWLAHHGGSVAHELSQEQINRLAQGGDVIPDNIEFKRNPSRDGRDPGQMRRNPSTITGKNMIALQERRGTAWITLALFRNDQKEIAKLVAKRVHRRHPGKQLRLFS